MNRVPAGLTRHQVRVLQALGVMLWRLRIMVVVLPPDVSTDEMILLLRALQALEPRLAQAPRIRLDGEAIIPSARVYLVLGQARTDARVRRLPEAAIVTIEAPIKGLGQADGKRQLWSALRRVRCMLAGT